MDTPGDIRSNAHQYMCAEGSDVVIYVKTIPDTWRIPAHSSVLCKHSDVFRRMLTPGNFKESECREIWIEDISPDIVLVLLRYLYVGEMWVDTLADALNLLQASHKYQINSLVQACERDAWRMLSPHTVCQVYDIADRLNLVELGEKCLDLILKAGVIVLESDGVIHLNRECLERVVNKTALTVDSEFKVLQVLWKWGKKECCRKGLLPTEEGILEVVGDLVRHIRHEKITVEQLCTLPSNLSRIIKSFPSPEPREASCIGKALLDYSTTLWLSTKSDWARDTYSLGYSSNRSIVFVVDRPFYLLALCLGVVSSRFPEFSISLERHDDPLKPVFTLSSDLARLNSQPVDDKWNQIVDFRLPAPLRLDLGVTYAVFINIKRTDSSVTWPRFFVNGSVSDASGRLSITVQGDIVWAVTEMLGIPAPHTCI